MNKIVNTVCEKYSELQSNYIKSREEVKTTIATKTKEADVKFAGKKIKMVLAHAYITVSLYMKPSHVGKTLAFRGLQTALITSVVGLAALLLTNFNGIHCLIKFAKDTTILAVMISLAIRILPVDIKKMFNKPSDNDSNNSMF